MGGLNGSTSACDHRVGHSLAVGDQAVRCGSCSGVAAFERINRGPQMG
jgi:hypothetical protein